MSVTRTLNPLPFHDLEPRRFEDLVRDLVYDFRPWLRLEATGRAGSDDGYDARGIERAGSAIEDAHADSDEEDDSDSEEVRVTNERTWLIQCKRERKIGPTQLAKYLYSIPPDERARLYGIIFVACCDFSKRSRDVMAAWCRDNNLSEFQIWSVSDIETMLMQPKNDHILFAFFGLSLQIRKRSVASALRARITMKRKVVRILKATNMHGEFLLRDPEANNFPYADEGKKLRWMIRDTKGFDFRGVAFQWKEYFAYANAKGEWDVANRFNRAIPAHGNPWLEFEERYPADEDRFELQRLHSEIEPESQAMLRVTVFLPFEEIVAIDEMGDGTSFGGRARPTLYVPFKEGRLPFHSEAKVNLSSNVEVKRATRIKFFPDKFRTNELD